MSRRSIALLLLSSLATGVAMAAENPFLGNWKLNPSKSKMTDQMIVKKAGTNKYAFDFIGDGGDEIIVIDGTDQAGNAKTTLSVTAVGPNAWKVVRKKDGRMLLTANWRLSEDGNTLTDEYTEMAPNGTSSTVNYVYQRKGKGSGFAGVWVSTSEDLTFDLVLQIRAYQKDGLTISDANSRLTRNLKPDGKDYPNVGQSAALVATSALRRLDERTLKVTDKRSNGKVFATQELKLSEDLKTLTITQHMSGRIEPSIFVFERQ